MKNRLVLTMGDPAGVGPEICLKLLAHHDLDSRPVIIGDVAELRRQSSHFGFDLHIEEIDSPSKSNPEKGKVEVIQAGQLAKPITVGEVDPECGQIAFDSVKLAIDFALAGEIDGFVTAPINKAAMAAAGINFPGHTEILAHYTDAKKVAMMLANEQLRVVLASIHVSLLDAIKNCTIESQLYAIRLAQLGAKAFGIEKPRIAVAGLNPHAGESGLFGREEIDVIAPAIELARTEGFDVSGPWPGDTVFMQARQGQFDIVVAQYHDQGLIPVKYLGIADGVNVTLGLPFVRTSPDHGTAFDIAGQGSADEASMLYAYHQALRLLPT
jgi:4-hydroxythreonine-4-phosphate dehydrogenase